MSTFRQQITQQCLTESGIDLGLFEAAIALHSDLELDASGDPSTPIHDALGWSYSRFGHQARESFEAALFLSESGETWQAKVSFKPKDGKGYFAPTGAGSKPYLPPVPPAIRRRIAARYGCDVPMEGSFWDWVAEHPELEIIYTEGGKKALSLLSQGYIAISLYGVNGGYKAKDAIGAPISPALIPELDPFCYGDRPVVLAFDQDSAAKTRRKVTAALFKFGGLLARSGCFVRLALWNGAKGKGIDDLIGNAGPEAAQTAIAEALSLDEYRLKLAIQNQLGGLTPALRLNTQKLETVEGTAIPQSGIIAISSAKGTGKTKMIAGLVGGDDAALLLGHRIALTRNLCNRLCINYRGDLDKTQGRYTDGTAYTLRVGGCVDGTLLSVNPADFEGCDLILDEVVQVLRHLLTSSTCNKDGKRPVLLARFTELVQVARRVILADADLDKGSINYIQSLRGDTTPAWLLVNDAKSEPWSVDFIESIDASAIVARLVDDVADGNQVFIATDSKAGSKRLNQIISTIEGAGGKVLLLNSETSGGEAEQAYIKAPDANLSHTVVIATPSMGTGVSIETHGAYDAVYGIFWGASSTDADMAQALARVRQPVPRIVWCAKRGNSFSRIGRDTNPLRLKKLLQDKTNATGQITAASLGALGAEITSYDWLNPHVDLWATIEAQRNRSMLALRSALKVRLLNEGHKLTFIKLDVNEAARDALKDARQQIRETEAEAIANAANLTPAQVTALESAESIDPDERYALQKWHLADFYAVPLDEVTPDLVLNDNDGRRRGQLRDLEQFINPSLAPDVDAAAIGKQAQWHKGICPWDTPHAELRRQVRAMLGLDQWLNSTDEWLSDSARLAEFKKLALGLAPQVKAALNISINSDMSGAQILGQLLDQVGIATESKQLRVDGDRKRIYWIDQAVKAQQLAILQRRAQRRNPAQTPEPAPVTPPPQLEILQGGCDRAKPPYTGDSWVGAEVQMRASLSPWLVTAVNGETATIKNTLSGFIRSAALADLQLLEVAV
ncbi:MULTISPECIES: plasmid replication protein, CyRepA1 family [Cyanophyceae]|uniref:DUF3854 domain-containing protein n=1 Tax=Leptolyngbya subtilissima DQ-A4 TaxID=2933933 RepID=A0ABV0KCI2_9CYAN|nr:plasmid replication protein, CyRepA1 family [Nodosilinea sp. FACHB-141]MBD2111722.1 DUF3854 domain-containing protein [Nodosilinea sp. FACHB-141]